MIMFIKSLVMTAALSAALGTTLLAGTAVASTGTGNVGERIGAASHMVTTTDPPFHCMGASGPNCDTTGTKSTPEEPVTKDPGPPTLKQVCSGWEGQVNTNTGSKFDNCKWIPGN
jgi:hypothetical protein